jgi:hypothetical protein
MVFVECIKPDAPTDDTTSAGASEVSIVLTQSLEPGGPNPTSFGEPQAYTVWSGVAAYSNPAQMPEPHCGRPQPKEELTFISLQTGRSAVRPRPD